MALNTTSVGHYYFDGLVPHHVGSTGGIFKVISHLPKFSIIK